MNANHPRMPHRTLLAAALLGGLALCGTALAHNEGGDRFKKMDHDGDGMVTRAEHEAAAREMFDAIDRDGDGAVNVTDIQAHMGHKKSGEGADKGMADGMGKLDADGDGMVSTAEHAAAARAMFDAMDADGDGSLSMEEARAAHGRMMKDDHGGHDGM